MNHSHRNDVVEIMAGPEGPPKPWYRNSKKLLIRRYPFSSYLRTYNRLLRSELQLSERNPSRTCHGLQISRLFLSNLLHYRSCLVMGWLVGYASNQPSFHIDGKQSPLWDTDRNEQHLLSQQLCFLQSNVHDQRWQHCSEYSKLEHNEPLSPDVSRC